MKSNIGRKRNIELILSFFSAVCLLMFSTRVLAEYEDPDPATLTYDLKEFEQIKKEIKENGLKWTAKLQPRASLEYRNRCKNMPSIEEIIENYADVFSASEVEQTVMLPPPPSEEDTFSWRTYLDKSWTTPAANQEDCGSCWVFSPVNCIETANNLANGDPNLDVNLSEQNVLSCVSWGSCESGGMAEVALQRAKSMGVPLETCHPYTATNGTCSDQCDTEEFNEGKVKVSDFGYIGNPYNPTSDTAIKSALSYGPVTTTMMVYSDFYYYESGVYERSPSSSDQGGHGITIIGWNDEHDSWYIENSWGTWWGQSGFGEIKRGNSQIAGAMSMWVEVGNFNTSTDLDIDAEPDDDDDNNDDDDTDTGDDDDDDDDNDDDTSADTDESDDDDDDDTGDENDDDGSDENQDEDDAENKPFNASEDNPVACAQSPDSAAGIGLIDLLSAVL